MMTVSLSHLSFKIQLGLNYIGSCPINQLEAHSQKKLDLNVHAFRPVNFKEIKKSL